MTGSAHKIAPRLAAWVTVFSLALIAGGCDSKAASSRAGNGGKTGSGRKDSTAATKPSAEKPVLAPLFEGWADPRAVLVFSGEQHGYVEPCGCSETQSGGLARRHDLVKQINDRGWPFAGLDVGGTLKRARKQSELKFAFTHKALGDMNYKALGFGPEELHMGPEFLFTAHSEASSDTTDPRSDVPFLAANVVLYGSRDLGTPTTHRVFQVGDVKVGVTAIVGEKHVASAGGDPGVLAVEPPAEAIKAVLPKLEAESPDVLVLLSHAPPSETKKYIEAFPQFDIVATAEGDSNPYDEQERIGDTILLRLGQKGKFVGAIGVFGEGESQSLQAELIDLDKDRFATSLAMVAHMQAYQDQLTELDLASNEAAVPHPSGSAYAGAEACGKCHKKAYKIWSKSRHGHAFESLAHGRPGLEETWVNRQNDPECLACHVTGWSPQDVLRFEGGFTSMEATPHLAAQGCENCHGPGKDHSDLELAFQQGAAMTDATKKARADMHLDKAWAKDNLCVKCHDLDNSPKFDFDLYWPKVVHSGRD